MHTHTDFYPLDMYSTLCKTLAQGTRVNLVPFKGHHFGCIYLNMYSLLDVKTGVITCIIFTPNMYFHFLQERSPQSQIYVEQADCSAGANAKLCSAHYGNGQRQNMFACLFAAGVAAVHTFTSPHYLSVTSYKYAALCLKAEMTGKLSSRLTTSSSNTRKYLTSHPTFILSTIVAGHVRFVSGASLMTRTVGWTITCAFSVTTPILFTNCKPGNCTLRCHVAFCMHQSSHLNLMFAFPFTHTCMDRYTGRHCLSGIGCHKLTLAA